jgi:hypothetical protein
VAFFPEIGIHHCWMNCPEYARLESEVEQALANLAQVTTLQLDLFRSRRFNRVMGVDKDLEKLVGEKERAIGALRQHVREHRCQSGEQLEPH